MSTWVNSHVSADRRWSSNHLAWSVKHQVENQSDREWRWCYLITKQVEHPLFWGSVQTNPTWRVNSYTQDCCRSTDCDQALSKCARIERDCVVGDDLANSSAASSGAVFSRWALWSSDICYRNQQSPRIFGCISKLDADFRGKLKHRCQAILTIKTRGTSCTWISWRSGDCCDRSQQLPVLILTIPILQPHASSESQLWSQSWLTRTATTAIFDGVDSANQLTNLLELISNDRINAHL